MKKRLVYLLFLMTAGCLQELPPGQDITDPATADHTPNIIVAGSRAPGVAFDTVNTGTGANTGTGDPIRTAFDKLNEVVNVANDVELYNVTSPIQTQLDSKLNASQVGEQIGDTITDRLIAAPIAISRPDSGLVTSGGYASGFDWYNGIESNVIKAAKKVTTIDPVLAYPIACVGGILTGQTTMTDGRAQYITFYIPEPITITGVRFVLQTQGNYTADEYNGAKLYQVTSASTFVRLDSTANNGNFWKGTPVTKNDFPFVGGTRVLDPGLYVVGFIWNASATTAAPAMYSSFNNSSATNVMYYGNGGADQTKLAGYLSTQTDLAVSEAFNDLTSDTVSWGIFLY